VAAALKSITRRAGSVAQAVAGIGLLLALWEVAPRLGWVRRSSLPPCSDVLREVVDLVGRPGFAASLADSGQRLAAGLLIALVIAIPLGTAMGRHHVLARVIDPLIVVVYPIPKAALVLLFVPWWGAGNVTRIGIVIVGAFVPIVVSAYHGARAVDRRVVWVARSLGAGTIARWAGVVVPGSLPMLVPGIRLALGVSIFTLLGSELLIRGEGVGSYLFTALDNGQTLTVFATSTVIAGCGFLLDAAYERLVVRRLPWLEDGA
jgi:NitT/TauT family transport system permease protein